MEEGKVKNSLNVKNAIAIMILYNPDVTLVSANIDNINRQVEKVLLINNSSKKYNFQGIQIINNGENLGVATALNIGLKFAINNNFTYAILLDQDSRINEDMVELLINGHNEHNYIGMTVPKIIYNGVTDSSFDVNTSNENVKFAITSGSCINLNIIKKVGFMDDSFFIDSVDFDYCFKIRMAGYKIIQIKKAVLYQQLGDLKEYGLLGIKFHPTNYNFIRQYYIVRNRLSLAKRYFRFSPLFFLKSILRILYHIFLIIVFEKDKMKKLIYIKKGIIDFLLNRMGKLKI